MKKLLIATAIGLIASVVGGAILSVPLSISDVSTGSTASATTSGKEITGRILAVSIVGPATTTSHITFVAANTNGASPSRSILTVDLNGTNTFYPTIPVTSIATAAVANSFTQIPLFRQYITFSASAATVSNQTINGVVLYDDLGD